MLFKNSLMIMPQVYLKMINILICHLKFIKMNNDSLLVALTKQVSATQDTLNRDSGFLSPFAEACNRDAGRSVPLSNV